jgi:hypothetical protein
MPPSGRRVIQPDQPPVQPVHRDQLGEAVVARDARNPSLNQHARPHQRTSGPVRASIPCSLLSSPRASRVGSPWVGTPPSIARIRSVTARRPGQSTRRIAENARDVGTVNRVRRTTGETGQPLEDRPVYCAAGFFTASQRPSRPRHQRHWQRCLTLDRRDGLSGHGSGRRPCSPRTGDNNRGPPARARRVSSPPAPPRPARTIA